MSMLNTFLFLFIFVLIILTLLLIVYNKFTITELLYIGIIFGSGLGFICIIALIIYIIYRVFKIKDPIII